MKEGLSDIMSCNLSFYYQSNNNFKHHLIMYKHDRENSKKRMESKKNLSKCLFFQEIHYFCITINNKKKI